MEVFIHSLLLLTLVFTLQFSSVKEESGRASQTVVKLMGHSADGQLCPKLCAKCLVGMKPCCLQCSH